MDIRIQSIHFDADNKLEEFVQKKVSKLETYFNKIVDAEVFLKLDNDGSQIRDKVAEIRLNVPGSTLFATEKSKKFEESVDLCAESLRRQIIRYKDKLKK